MYRDGRFRVWKQKHICECTHELHIFHPRFGTCRVEDCPCKKFKRKNQPNKLHARKQEFNGILYDSGLEARVAADLEYQRSAGEILEIKRQFPVDFAINGLHITRHYVDFRVLWRDGTVELIEAKGMRTPIWVLKRRLLEALYLVENPGIKYRVVR